jgi:D-beta-D-heptose 7-phosphate kinase/D-beta-D-heptose 1-phosphate adenosyltransferase
MNIFNFKQIKKNPNFKKKFKNIRIGFTNGCFDLIHPGHINFFNNCKKKCDLLIVGLNSDHSIKRIKGINKPLIKEKYRAIHLSNLIKIDYVIIFNELNPLKLIEFLEPDILFKGSEYQRKNIIGYEYMKKNNKQIIRIKTLNKKIFSSSKLIKNYE